MAITFPGVVLSSLIFHLKNRPGDTVGILLGKIFHRSVAAITDSESQGTRQEKKICIQEYVILEGRDSFTDTRGKVDFDRLDQLLDKRLEDVVGWFTYRCNSSHRISIMEKAIHKNLMTSLPHSLGKDLVFGLFSEHTPEDPGLHSLEHSFTQWNGSHPRLVHVDIVNLKSTATMPYQSLPLVPLPSSVQQYDQLLNQTRHHFIMENGETVHSLAMEELFKALHQRFEPLQEELKKSCNTILSLEEELRELKEQLSLKEKEKEIPEEKEPVSVTDKQLGSTDDNSTDPLILLGNDMGGVDLKPQPDLHSDRPHQQQNGSALLVDLLGDLPSSVDNTSVIVPTDDFEILSSESINET